MTKFKCFYIRLKKVVKSTKNLPFIEILRSESESFESGIN
jgi:hypothetical protein